MYETDTNICDQVDIFIKTTFLVSILSFRFYALLENQKVHWALILTVEMIWVISRWIDN